VRSDGNEGREVKVVVVVVEIHATTGVLTI
jgi:hypothetical protein